MNCRISIQSDLDIELQHMCRICLKVIDTSLKNNCTAISVNTDNALEIFNKITLCFNITLPHNKHFPKIICKDCINELNIVNNFRLKCITVDERFLLYCKQKVNEGTIKTKSIDNNSVDCEANLLNLENNDSTDIERDCTFSIRRASEKSIENIINNIIPKEETKTFKCNLCNKVLKTKSTLLKHQVSMHEKRKHIGKVTGSGSTRRYHCTLCSYSTPHSQTLVSHIRTHNGERPYSCECGKSFTQSSSLAAHRKSHSSTTYFTCTLCGKQFKHAFAMKNHCRVHESPSFPCNICLKSLKSKETLQAHMHRHYNICNYNCEDCGDTFVTSAELINHRKKHSDKKIECHLCGYKTHAKRNLVMHLKRHTGNRSYKCDICHVGYYTKSDLRTHLRVHTGEKPYLCLTCGQKFTYSPSLNKHMKTMHGIDYKWSDWRQNKIKICEKT